MTELEVVTLGREMILTALMLAAPLLGAGLLIGLAVSIFQAVTQINEMTLTFVPKIIVVGLSLGFFLPWILRLLSNYTIELMNNFGSFID